MTARCKFQVEEVTHWTGDRRKVKLAARYDQPLSQEDRAFQKATPTGDMTIQIDNPNVFDVFVPGRYVYIDVTPVDQ
jgi:hypothetical protein